MPDSPLTEVTIKEIVTNTLDNLKDKDKSIIIMQRYGSIQHSSTLKIPLGTVKSRLYKARQNFKEIYPHTPTIKGEFNR